MFEISKQQRVSLISKECNVCLEELSQLCQLQDGHFKNHCVLEYFSHFVDNSCCLVPSMWFSSECVKDGIMHFTCKKQVMICFIDVANFSDRWDCVVTRFDGKVHSTIYSIEGRVRQSCQEGLFIQP